MVDYWSHACNAWARANLVVRLSFLLCFTMECHFEALRKQDRTFYSHRFLSTAGKSLFLLCIVVSKKASMAQKAIFSMHDSHVSHYSFLTVITQSYIKI